MNKHIVLVAVIAGLAVAGCSSRAKRSTSSPAESETTSASSESVYTAPEPATAPRAPAAPASRAPVAPRTGAAVAAAAAPTASAHVIYFEFDSATITPEGLVVVDQWAKFLGANPSAKVRLEGHADERGTREYNIGLGERRANSVQEALAARGVGPRQFAIVSFGEERPVALGHDEPAWRQNRRVEIAD